MATAFRFLPPQTTTETIVESAGGAPTGGGLLIFETESKPLVGNMLSLMPPITVFTGFDGDGLPTFRYQPAFTDEEIRRLIALADEDGQPLLSTDDMDALYQFALMVIQLKFTVPVINSNQADLASDVESEETDAISSSSSSASGVDVANPDSPSVLSETERLYQQISVQQANNFDRIIDWLSSKPWVIPDEAVHESPLLTDSRVRIAIKILDMEQEPMVEEGSIVCKNQSCRGRRIMRTFAQTRSGDEGFTAFYTCTDCGRKF